jgi:hypothetical protein
MWATPRLSLDTDEWTHASDTLGEAGTLADQHDGSDILVSSRRLLGDAAVRLAPYDNALCSEIIYDLASSPLL